MLARGGIPSQGVGGRSPPCSGKLRVFGEGPKVNLTRRWLPRDATLLLHTPPSSSRDVCLGPTCACWLLLLASLAQCAFRVPFLTSLRHSTRACGIERSVLKMLFGASLMMERLNAYDRSPTVKAQRSQPTGAVDFLLEPLPLACARDTSRVLRHPALGLLAARAQHAPRLLRPCVWTSWCSATGGKGCSRAGGLGPQRSHWHSLAP